MEQNEKNQLRNGMLFMPIFPLLLGVMGYFVTDDFTNGESAVWFVFGGFSLFFMGVLFYIFRATYLDWKSGVKRIIQGIVTRKEHSVHRRYKKSGRSHQYFLHFDDFQLCVKLHQFRSVEEGDLVQFDFSKRSQVVFKHQVMKKNALEELNEKGMALEEPKMPKQIGIVQMLLIFGGFIFIVLSTLFGVISDCFNCGSEYNSSIERWQNYEPNQILVDQNDRDSQQILLMLNDTLTDAEEGEVIRIFENAAKQGRSGLMVDFLSNRVFDYDTLNGFEWLRVKWNEDFPRTNTSFVGLWKMVLYAVTASDIFKKKLFINEFQFSKVEALCLRDKKITYEQIKKIYANKSKKSMVYALMTDIQSDTSIYAPGVNRLMKEVFNIPESEYPRQTKSNFYKTQIERAKEIYGL